MLVYTAIAIRKRNYNFGASKYSPRARNIARPKVQKKTLLVFESYYNRYSPKDCCKRLYIIIQLIYCLLYI